jgi:hypothetical protein
MKVCHHCGKALSMEGRPQRTDACPTCYSDLKCCRNCRFFDPGANNQCAEPQAEWCPDKDKANFCEYFEFRETAGAGTAGPGAEPDDARAAFAKLFRK